MRKQLSTLGLGLTMIASVLVACSVDSNDDAQQSSESALRAVAPDPVATAIPEPAPEPSKPPKDCDTANPDGSPKLKCIAYCQNDLQDNQVYRCASNVLGATPPGGTPSRSDLVACGCNFLGVSDTIKGGRDVFSCGGSLPFYISVVPGQTPPRMGIGVNDPNYPGCIFDEVPGGPGNPPTVAEPNPDKCLTCHDDPKHIFKPLPKKTTTATTATP